MIVFNGKLYFGFSAGLQGNYLALVMRFVRMAG